MISRMDLYHGTEEDFDSFSLRYFNRGSGDGGWLGYGIYLTNDFDYAESYGDVLVCSVNVRNPLVLTDHLYSSRPYKLANKFGARGARELTFKLKSEGYDSVILTYKDPDRFFEVCVFDPKKVTIK